MDNQHWFRSVLPLFLILQTCHSPLRLMLYSVLFSALIRLSSVFLICFSHLCFSHLLKHSYLLVHVLIVCFIAAGYKPGKSTRFCFIKRSGLTQILLTCHHWCQGIPSSHPMGLLPLHAALPRLLPMFTLRLSIVRAHATRCTYPFW
jgi:hypothetical protein